ncbi:metalloregulator ArsR/SmtB family transcription factor [Cytobacillus sp. IB215665]|uniref:metalloregulator ArsR/SmtB family transcription factor n=1 Tax=Cytobacillus sp. IB215665 TaxID=3097357 RepID=UPI002A10A1FF|nr:metalloregulator ArsR/SmtB family transcription factor [Cytobacillus sp. IB215665]MDX8366329.1 metalloregulator ArsR/SmtB family transcription factor [Cytobacillus sp. IB215665]
MSITDFYRAIADPIRRTILSMLSHNEKNQSEIVNRFNISQPAIKKHLKILKEEELIYERREGRYCLYGLKMEIFQKQYGMLKQELEAVLDQKLASLKNYLEEDDD